MFFMGSIWFKTWDLIYFNAVLQEPKIINYLFSLFSPRKRHLSSSFLAKTALLIQDALEKSGIFIRDVFYKILPSSCFNTLLLLMLFTQNESLVSGVKKLITKHATGL